MPQHGCGGAEDNFVKWGPLLSLTGSEAQTQVCMASALPTEPTCQPWGLVLMPAQNVGA